MNRVEALNLRYLASAYVARNGVQITAVGDPVGARFNAAVRSLVQVARHDGPGIWNDLVGVSKALRWKLITQPQPIEFNPGMVELAIEVSRQARRQRAAVGDESLLEELSDSATGLLENASIVGSTLLQDCLEAGAGACLVVAASKPAQASLHRWLQSYGIVVATAGELERLQPDRELAYIVGPPRFYRSSLMTAPVVGEVSFLIPSWFGDRSVPRSAIAAYAEGAIRVRAKVFHVGDTTESDLDEPAQLEDEDAYLPQPVWGAHTSHHRGASSEEVEAHKLLLSGNLAMWLDDGERIRSIDPRQPAGERVTYVDVPSVRVGTYLLIRQGATERSALHQAAIAKLGQRGSVIEEVQNNWKRVLSGRLERLGHWCAVSELRAAGVVAADRAKAWTNPSLIRPNRDRDFEALLQWLGLPVQPTFGYATLLRKTLYQVSAEIGKQLELAVGAADLNELEARGHLGLDVDALGFRGILATRVLGISPFTEIVSRHDARVPFEDRGAQWLE